jgi:diguanylate cyclase (GGDEF)-like protein
MATASLDGRERLVGRARLGDTDATLAVMLPLDQVVRIASIRAWREFVTIVIGGTILLAAIWLGGEMLVVRPIRSLTRGAEILGAGEFAINIPTEGLPPELRRLAETFNAMAERLDDREARLRDANQALASLAAKDPLTGLANRRAFDERMASEWSRARRERKPLALLMIDVDHFKSFNDAYGHLEGDSCLRHVAAVMEGCARRGGDFAARIGGEEFALILPGASRSAAATVAEHLRGAIAGLGIEHEKVQEGHVTISAGVAATTTASAESPDFLINQADTALYEAKWGGRNKVCLARPDVSLAS